MFINICELPSGRRIQHQVCVVGSGPAGMTIARKLGELGYDVAIMESGSHEFDERTQALYKGDAPGYEPIYANRLRYFGGSSNHWAGYCRPFTPGDFVPREWIPNAEWPITYEQIQPYLAPAWEVCSFGRGDPSWLKEHNRKTRRMPPLPLDDRVFEYTPVQQILARQDEQNDRNEGISFATAYGADLEASQFIHTYLNANVTEIHVTEAGDRIDFLEVRTFNAKSFPVRAKVYILACGGIENARLLLASNVRHREGLANSSGAVGRNFTDHPIIHAGHLATADTPHSRVGIHGLSGNFRLREEVQRAVRLTNGIFNAIPITDPGYEFAKTSPGVRSFRSLSATLREGSVADMARDVMNVALNFDDVAARVYAKLAPDSIPIESYTIAMKLEMEPTTNNRVTLSEKVDEFGKPLAKIEFRLSDNDLSTISRSLDLFGQQVGRYRYGRLRKLIEDRESLAQTFYKFSHHHIGTTRMSSNPGNGVTDGNCRSHDIGNLFIAGSSVFSTCGSGTPTLMIVALALRLADYVASHMPRVS